MKLIKVPNYAAMSQEAFTLVAAEIKQKPQAVLGLATGSTPIGLYQKLIAAKLDWAQITTFNLDEYIGLTSHHPLSYDRFMQENLFQHINIERNHYFLPDSFVKTNVEAAQYDHLIATHGGIDLQILGIGQNAHIGFNEPGAPQNGTTAIVELTESTIAANARFFANIDAVPKKAISMGIGSILKSRKIILLASGLNKAAAIAAMFEKKPDRNVPASWLQNHRDVTVIADFAASSLLKRAKTKR